MTQTARPVPGQKYRHFKGGLYQVITNGVHSETNEEMVVYQALYGDFQVYIRPLSMFLELLDKTAYPNAEQKLRFQPICGPDATVVSADSQEPTASQRTSKTESVETEGLRPEGQEAEVNPYLLQFLEAETFGAKLKIFLEMRDSINEVLLTEIAASLDISTGTGTLEEQYASVQYALHTLAKYERNKR
ncbi:MAG: DUF1653 domain-containing protein [Bacteroides sp.]|nr:DUF1653 domain-containing protein [Bacteroides sp.]MCM1548670.1 DUF1653 domain-containing protein [Clostridium sp.]